MNMLGHHHIGEELKPQSFASPAERPHEELSALAVLEGGCPAVNGEGQQMQVPINVDRLALFQLHNPILGFSLGCCKMEGCGV